MSNSLKSINCREYHTVVRKLRLFFEEKNFVEVHTQSRLSILAACEDPRTIATFNYSGKVWPLPQTGQMWLEHELLKNPDLPGLFCVSTSFRNEPNPVEGRHDLIFPMFEFEMKGDIFDLHQLEVELLLYLGFGNDSSCFYPTEDYDDLSMKYHNELTELTHADETQMEKDYGSAILIKNFPLLSSPFWNMKLNKEGTHANKIDVILHGMETIGSAERSTDKTEMFEQFHSISDGEYANTLYAQFSKERVEKELSDFLEFNFFERCGGGIGVTRMIRALKISKLI